MQPATPDNSRPSQKSQGLMSGLFGDVTQTVRQLLREELQLARDQVSDKASDVATDAGMIAAGGVVAYAGYLTVLGGVAVGAATIAGGTALILRGLDNLQLKQPVVEVTREQMNDTVDEIERDVD